MGGCSGRGSGWPSCGLIVAGGVEGELAEEFAGGGVDDADVEVLDEQDDVGSGVGPADADVVEAAAVAQGDVAGLADGVGADAVVGAGGFGPGRIRGGDDLAQVGASDGAAQGDVGARSEPSLGRLSTAYF